MHLHLSDNRRQVLRAAVVMLLVPACNHSFQLQAKVVDQAGQPIPAATMTVESLGLTTQADSGGKVVLKGRASGGCYLAVISMFTYHHAYWTFDPRHASTLKTDRVVLRAEPFEMPPSLIHGCEYPDSAIGGGRMIDTVMVLTH